MDRVPIKTIVVGLVFIVALILAGAFISGVYSVVPPDKYEIKKTWVTGTLDVKMTPGFWFTWGTVQRWPRAETFYFTADKAEGKSIDQSVEVQFNDGSLCKISGTCRVLLSANREDALGLQTHRGFMDFTDLEHKLILPTVRKALTATASLMTARESYSEKRLEFINRAWDQIVHGVYETTETEVSTKDPLTGEMTVRKISAIKKDKDGKPVRQANPFRGTGITLDNFEIKYFVYEKVVKDQIATQQQAYMAVETARANAAAAEQDKITKEAQGKAKVTESQYEKEKEKVKAVVEAKQKKEVAEIDAAQKLAVAELAKKEAEQLKQGMILRAEGEARKRELQVAAGLDPRDKAQIYENILGKWAEAYAKRPVPNIMIGGTGDGKADGDGLSLNQALSIKVLQDLALDMKLPGTGKPAIPATK